MFWSRARGRARARLRALVRIGGRARANCRDRFGFGLPIYSAHRSHHLVILPSILITKGCSHSACSTLTPSSKSV